jgi:transposase
VNKPQKMLADKGFDSNEVRSALLMTGITPVIPPKANRKNPPDCDFNAYKDRNRIERMFNRLKQFRRIATRYEKNASSYEGFLKLAAACIWIASFVNAT